MWRDALVAVGRQALNCRKEMCLIKWRNDIFTVSVFVNSNESSRKAFWQLTIINFLMEALKRDCTPRWWHVILITMIMMRASWILVVFHDHVMGKKLWRCLLYWDTFNDANIVGFFYLQRTFGLIRHKVALVVWLHIAVSDENRLTPFYAADHRLEVKWQH